MKKKLSCAFLAVLLFCTIMTPFVSAKHSFFAGENVIIFTEDFEGYEAGIDVIDAIGGYWLFEDSNGLSSDSEEFTLVDNDAGGKALYCKWILGRLVKSTEAIPVKSPFIFGGKIKAQGDELVKHGTHIWIRSTITPFVTDGGKNMKEYEGDEDEEIGGYGFAIELHNKKIEAVIRETSDQTVSKLAAKRHSFDLPEGVELTNNFTEFKIVDDGSKIYVSFADTLMFTVEYSEAKDGLYTKAIVKDPAGTTVLESTSATLCADEKEASVAFSNRAGIFSIDNFYYISNYKEGKNVFANKATYTTADNIDVGFFGAVEKDWVGIYKKGTTPSAENKPIARVDANGTGAATFKADELKLEAGDYEVILFNNEGYEAANKFEIKVELAATPEPTTAPTATPAPTSTKTPKNNDGPDVVLISIIALAVVAVVIIVIAIVIIMKKKKK